MNSQHQGPRIFLMVTCIIIAGALAACGGEQTATNTAPMVDRAGPLEDDTPQTNGITAEALATYTRELADDSMLGRAPAGPGELPTLEYLQTAYKRIGLEPAGNSALPGGPENSPNFFQQVGLVTITADPSTAYLSFVGTPEAAQLKINSGEDFVTWTTTPEDTVDIAGGLVFVGYGVNAPEENWNDFADMDMTGKVLLMLVNDPPLDDGDRFGGEAMTYYGRWTYKYEEAARQGAAAALIVHETGPAGYGWDVVSNSWSGPQIGLQAADLNGSRTEIEGWLTLDSAEALFDGAGLDYVQLKASAAIPGFTAVPLADIKASVSIKNSVRTSVSQNVIAAIPGTARPDETIIYTAHWDHLGVNPEVPGDNIYNGAADNATGTAGLLALASLHSQAAPAERSIVFLAVTAEESGLLGSQWYAEHPIYPIPGTVANINMDNLNTVGRTYDVVVVGANSSELEIYLEEAATAQGRYLEAEPNPERGSYYRSDHFNFARVGVPALYAESGEDNVEFGKEYGALQAQDYTDNRYHAPSDEYDPEWNLGGAAQDILLYFDIAQKLSGETSFPEWFEGNEFKNIRELSREAL